MASMLPLPLYATAACIFKCDLKSSIFIDFPIFSLFLNRQNLELVEIHITALVTIIGPLAHSHVYLYVQMSTDETELRLDLACRGKQEKLWSIFLWRRRDMENDAATPT